MQSQPLYTDQFNDDTVQFVGHFMFDGNTVDGYVQVSNQTPVSVMMVQSNEPGDYQSLPAHMVEMVGGDNGLGDTMCDILEAWRALPTQDTVTITTAQAAQVKDVLEEFAALLTTDMMEVHETEDLRQKVHAAIRSVEDADESN